ALHGRAQRHPDDDRAAPRERLSAQARDRSVRSALRGREGARQDHGAGDPSLHQRPAAPDQISRSDLRLRQPLRGRAALERRRDPGGVPATARRQGGGGMNAPEPRRMLPTDRLAYSAIAERPPLKLPGGGRMAVWVIVNVEEWDATAPMPRTVLTP